MKQIMVLAKRPSDVSLDEFTQFIISDHSKFVMNHIPNMKRYVHNFVTPAPYSLDGVLKDLDYDVLTEIWFDDAQYEEGIAKLAEIHGSNDLLKSDRKFVDRAKTRIALIEEHESELPLNRDRAPDFKNDLRNIVLLKRRSDISLDDFINHYEGRHAPLAVKNSPTLSRYRRFFLRPVAGPDGSVGEIAYDVVTEVSRSPDLKGAPMTEEARQIYEIDETKFTHKPSRRYANIKTHELISPQSEISK